MKSLLHLFFCFATILIHKLIINHSKVEQTKLKLHKLNQYEIHQLISFFALTYRQQSLIN